MTTTTNMFEEYQHFLNRGQFSYQAPSALAQNDLLRGDHVTILSKSNAALKEAPDCAICMCSLVSDDSEDDNNNNNGGDPQGQRPIQLRCMHIFHHSCLEQSVQHKPSCAVCRKPVREPQGLCPSGTMRLTVLKGCHCPGFLDEENGSPVKTIEIFYNIPDGIQKTYHTNPGVKFSGASRTAYLPYNIQGLQLLARLVYAFEHGLIFTVGTSLTTHQSNVVTWTSIHHKTSLHGGMHGFPDPGYILNCNESLDALHVPDAETCKSLTSAGVGRRPRVAAAVAAVGHVESIGIDDNDDDGDDNDDDDDGRKNNRRYAQRTTKRARKRK